MSGASAQNPADSISVRKTGLGTVFQQNGRNLNGRDLVEITKSNPDAYKEMKIAKGNLDAGNVFGFAGGYMVGWPIGTAIAGGEPNWALAAIGAGLIIISIPLSTGYTKHAKNAVSIYNSGLKQSRIDKVKSYLGFTSNGFGIVMKF